MAIREGKPGTYFYKEKDNDYSIKSCFFDTAFPDLWNNGTTQFKLGNDGSTQSALFNFKLPTPPNYGDAELAGAEADFYFNGTTSSTGGQFKGDKIKAYKSSSVIGTEGGHTGDNMIVNDGALVGKGRNLLAYMCMMSTANINYGCDFSSATFGMVTKKGVITKRGIGTDPVIPFDFAYDNGRRFGAKTEESAFVDYEVDKETYKEISEGGGINPLVVPIHSGTGVTTDATRNNYREIQAAAAGTSTWWSDNKFAVETGGNAINLTAEVDLACGIIEFGAMLYGADDYSLDREYYTEHAHETVKSIPTQNHMLKDFYLDKDIKEQIYYRTIVPVDPEDYTFQMAKTMTTDESWWDKIHVPTTHVGVSFDSDGTQLDKRILSKANIYGKNEGLVNSCSMAMETIWEPTTSYHQDVNYGSRLFSTDPLAQECYAYKTNIPAPVQMQSEENASGEGQNSCVVSPTIEITMNIKKLAGAYQVGDDAFDAVTYGSVDNQEDKPYRLNRCIALCLSERAPQDNEQFYDFVKYHSDNDKVFFGMAGMNMSNKMVWQPIPETFDTANRDICLDGNPANPSIDDAMSLTNITGNYITCQFECGAKKANAGDDGDLYWSVYNATSKELVSPIRKLNGFHQHITTLNEGGTLLADDETITLTDASNFPTSGKIRIGSEKITYTGKSSNNLTGCARGTNSTTATTHADGSTVTSGFTLSTDWPGVLSMWLVNMPSLTGGANSCSADADSSDYYSGLEISEAMAADSSVGPFKVRKQIGTHGTSNLASNAPSIASVLRIGELVLLDDEICRVEDVKESSNSVSSGNASLDGPEVRLVRAQASTSAATHAVGTKIGRCNMTDPESAGTAHSLVLVDNISLKNFNYAHNNASKVPGNYGDRLHIPKPEELIARTPADLTEQSKYDGTTEWDTTFDNNGAYAKSNYYWCIGFTSQAQIEKGGSGQAHLFWSDFSSAAMDSDDIPVLPYAKNSKSSAVRVGYSDSDVALGCQYKNEVFQNNDANRTSSKRGLVINTTTDTTSITTGPDIILSALDGTADANYTDGFKQTGFMTIEGGYSSESAHIPRENILVSARITKVINERTVAVDNTSALGTSAKQGMIIYKAGQGYTTSNYRYRKAAGSGTAPVTIEKIVGNIVTFNCDVLKAEDNSTSLVTAANVKKLFVGPRAAWLIFEFSDPSKFSKTFDWTPRSYGGVTEIQLKDGAHATAGATLRETLFSDTYPLTNKVSRALNSPSDSTLSLETDYGYGVYEPTENPMGGYFDELNNPTDGAYNTIDISSVVTEDGLKEGDEFSFYLTPNNRVVGTWTIESEDSTNYPVKYYSKYWDELPEISEFTVSPSEINASFPTYKWKVDADDAWYGLLLTDHTAITNQYHNSVSHIPLNENALTYTGVYSNTSTAASAGTFTNSKAGLSGYSKHFNGSSDYLKFGHAAISTKPTNKMSVVAHFVPDNTPTGDEYIIFKDDGSGSGVDNRVEFAIYINSTGQVGAKVKTSVTTHTLLSGGIITIDGDTPTAVILTIDGTIKSENVKLFVNGALQDSTAARKSAGSTNHWQTSSTIGASGVSNNDLYIGAATTDGSARSNFFDGKIEEIVIYNDVIYPISPALQEMTLTKPVEEQNSGAIKPIATRIFIKDYHNIRGKKTEEVASSPMISFSKPSFNLYG